jgi:hypothetical protein
VADDKAAETLGTKPEAPKSDAPKSEVGTIKTAVPLLKSEFKDGGPTPNLTAALVEAVKSTPWVEFTKPEKGDGGIKYDYIAEEDVVKALRKILPLYGLTVVPRAMELVQKEIYNSKHGSRMCNLLLCVTYRISHTSGEFVEGQTFGEGSDTGDKAANKAMTAAFKYFLREVTLIAGGNDPDKTASEELGRAAKDKSKGGNTGGGGSTGGSKTDKKPEKTLEQRLADAKAHIAKLNTHEAIKSAAKQVGEVFKNDKEKQNQAYNACASRATLLFVASVGKAEDLEAIEKILKAAESDKIGTENLKKVKEAAEKRQAAIVGESGGGDDGGQTHDGDDEAAPLEF